MTRLPIALVLVASGVASLLGAGRPVPGTAPTNRTVHVTVIDKTGTPVTDLTAREFAVKEDGKTRDVVEVVPATAPLKVSFIVADNGTGYFQRPVAQCIQTLLGHGQFSINLVEGPSMKLVDFTADVPQLRNAIAAFGRRPAPRTESQILEGIYNVADAFAKSRVERPVIIVLAYASLSELKTVQSDYVLDRLRDSGATLHTISAVLQPLGTAVAETAGPGGGGRGSRGGGGGGGGTGTGGGRGGSSGGYAGSGAAELRKTLGDGPGQSGGHRDDILESDGRLPMLEQIAAELLHQYRVTYVLPDGVKPAERLSVSVTRKNVDVLAPSRVAVE